MERDLEEVCFGLDSLSLCSLLALDFLPLLLFGGRFSSSALSNDFSGCSFNTTIGPGSMVVLGGAWAGANFE